MRISLDAGHGQNNTGNGKYDPGACSNGLQEHTVVKGMAYRVRDGLIKKGHEVLVQESGPYYTRDEVASRFKADVHVALHCDASTSSTATGVTVFVNRSVSNGSSAWKWAESIGEELASVQGIPFRGVSQKDFGTLAGKTLDCLVELFFLTNPRDVKAYQSHVDEVESTLVALIPTKPASNPIAEPRYYWTLIHSDYDEAVSYRQRAEADGNAVRHHRTSKESYRDIDDVAEGLPD